MSNDERATPTGRRATRTRAAGLLLVLAGAAIVSIGSATGAAQAAEPLAFMMSFDDLAPGETRTQEASVVLERDAVLQRLGWQDRDGVLDRSTVDLTACDDAVCTSAGTFVPTPMTAGPIDIRVTVTAATDMGPAEAGTALGRLTFAAVDDELAATGAHEHGAAWWGAALGVLGIALVTSDVVGRRSRPRGRGR